MANDTDTLIPEGFEVDTASAPDIPEGFSVDTSGSPSMQPVTQEMGNEPEPPSYHEARARRAQPLPEDIFSPEDILAGTEEADRPLVNIPIRLLQNPITRALLPDRLKKGVEDFEGKASEIATGLTSPNSLIIAGATLPALELPVLGAATKAAFGVLGAQSVHHAITAPNMPFGARLAEGGAGLGMVLPAVKVALPRTMAALKTSMEGGSWPKPKEVSPDAVPIKETAGEVRGVPAQPGQNEGALPAEEGAGGVPQRDLSQEAAPAGEVQIKQDLGPDWEIDTSPGEASPSRPPGPVGYKPAVKTPEGEIIAGEHNQIDAPEGSTRGYVSTDGRFLTLTEVARENQPGLARVGPGAASPSEFAPEKESVTSIKNAQVDQERQARNLPPAMEPARRAFGEVWDDAMRIVNDDALAVDDLLGSLRNNPRALTDTEDALLLHRQIDLQNDFEKASNRMAEAQAEGNEAGVVEQRARTAGLSDQLLDLYNIGKKVGTETGRGLNARKMLANEDFSLAAMERQKRTANDGNPLTSEQSAEVKAQHDKIQKTQKAVEAHEATAEERRATNANIEAVKEIVKSVPQFGADVIRIAKGIVDRWDKEADIARSSIRERLARTSAGLDPTLLIDLAKVGRSYFGHAALDLTEFSTKMIGEFGEYVKPHLQAIYDRARNLVADEEGKQPETVKAAVRQIRTSTGNRTSIVEAIKNRLEGGDADISTLVQKLARGFVGRGIIERDALIDSVHGVLKTIDPRITRRDAMDAISGYGKYKLLTKDEISVQLRDLKGQMQQVGKLEDMQKGQAPSKTGVERRTPSDEERRLIQQVNEAKKKGGYNITDPVRQLKSALDAIKTRLKNSIKDLELQIATKTKIVKDRRTPPTDVEADTLRAQRDKLREEYDSIFGKPELTDDQRIRRASSALDRQIAEVERQLKSGEIFPANKPSKTPVTPELEAKRAELEALKQEREYARETIQPKLEPHERSNLALKTRLRNRIAEYQKRLANGDFSTRKRTAPDLDRESMKLKAEAEEAKLAFKRGVYEDQRGRRTKGERFQDRLVKWRRAFILSGPVTLAKLTSAAVQRLVFSLGEELVGAAIGKLPGISKIAAKAPREGGFNATAEAKAITEAITTGMKDAAQTLKTGKSQLDTLLGRRDLDTRDWTDWAGNLHGALKTHAKRAEFTRSLIKRTEFEIRNGVDVSDPMVQMRLMTEAYRDANRSIFLQDNRVVDFYRRGIQALERVDKTTGKTPVGAKALATTAKVLLPIVRVPTNIVAETMQYALGSITGSVKVGLAIRRGIETLKPEEADLIMRQLKKGSIGGAMMITGFLLPDTFGGYYQKGEKRRSDDVKYGSIRLGDVEIPSFVLHNPLLETLQLGATIRRVADSKLKKSDKDTQGVTAGLLAGAIGLAEQVPFVREMAEVAKAFDVHERGAFLGELGKSLLVPQLLQSIAKATDPDVEEGVNRRKPEGVIDYIKTGLPGLREDVPLVPIKKK